MNIGDVKTSASKTSDMTPRVMSPPVGVYLVDTCQSVTDVDTKSFIALMTGDRAQLLPFLDTCGSKVRLTKLLHRVSSTASPPCQFRTLMLNSRVSDMLFELPTNELCDSLLNLLRHFKINRVLEPAAGSGLLSARLDRRQSNTSASTGKIQFSPSDPSEKQLNPETKWSYKPFVTQYMPIATESFKTLSQQPIITSKSLAVLVSWLWPKCQPDLLYMLSVYRPTLVCLIGEPVGSCMIGGQLFGGATYDEDLLVWAKKNDYSVHHVHPKQICYKDAVNVLDENDSRSSLLVLVSAETKTTPPDIERVCGLHNLGTCKMLNDEPLRLKLMKREVKLVLEHDRLGISDLQLARAALLQAEMDEKQTNHNKPSDT